MANHSPYVVIGAVRAWMTSLVPGLLDVLGLPNANLRVRDGVRVGVTDRVRCNYITRGVHMLRLRLRVRFKIKIKLRLRLRLRVMLRVSQHQK